MLNDPGNTMGSKATLGVDMEFHIGIVLRTLLLN